MITLKAIHKDGSEQVFEVKSFSHRATQNRIDAVDCDREPFSICLNDDSIVVVYAMNSAGSTVGRYFYFDSAANRADYKS